VSLLDAGDYPLGITEALRDSVVQEIAAHPGKRSRP
jgi:hypothetical protein